MSDASKPPKAPMTTPTKILLGIVVFGIFLALTGGSLSIFHILLILIIGGVGFGIYTWLTKPKADESDNREKRFEGFLSQTAHGKAKVDATPHLAGDDEFKIDLPGGP